MKIFRMLVLTDHGSHTSKNSIYPFLKQLRQHPDCAYIDVASRSHPSNRPFFYEQCPRSLTISRVDDDFEYDPDGRSFFSNTLTTQIEQYEVILLRLPHPVESGFWPFLTRIFPEKAIINQPGGVEESGKKSFLLNVPELCPPMKLCHNISDIKAFKAAFPIVLKPIEGYGGKGIIKIEGDQVWQETTKMSFDAFEREYYKNPEVYLGMKYLQHVDQGDKRVVVINGKIIGAALRLPAEGEWLCNSAQGGSSRPEKVAPEEIKIAERLSEVLREMGVIFFGFDTLMGDAGQRVLSEVNTLSIGGLPYLEPHLDRPPIELATDLIWDYIRLQIHGKSN